MTDYLSRACKLQLTTAVENLVRTAVFEISQIFEGSIHDHKVELAHKEEEIAHLKVKLQRAELKLRDISVHSETDVSITQTTLRKSEQPPPEELTASEIDFDVPYDWCVPLGSENVVKHENPCPSVRLRQFSIPLWPISLKHEAFRKIEAPRLRPRHNRDKIDLHDKIEHKQKRGSSRIRSLETNKVKHLQMKIKQEPSDIEVESPTRRKGLSGKVRKTSKLSTKAHKKQDNAIRQEYQCRFCPKIFDTALGLSVHDRAHRKCNGCKKIFPFPSVVDKHKVGCKYYKKLMKLSVPSPEKEKNSSNIQQIKSNTLAESVPRKRVFKKYTCTKCMRKFASRSLLLKHSCNFVCQICSKRFSSSMNLNVHKAKMHKKTKENKLELSWTKPLDESECKLENDFSESEKNIKKCSNGFKCLLCKRVFATKYSALEHCYLHTGEKPHKCGLCTRTFSRRAALSKHRINFHGMHLKKYLTCACTKRFVNKFRYKDHKLSCPSAIAEKTKKKA